VASSGPAPTHPCPSYVGGPRAGRRTPGGVSQEQSKGAESPPSTCWPWGQQKATKQRKLLTTEPLLSEALQQLVKTTDKKETKICLGQQVTLPLVSEVLTWPGKSSQALPWQPAPKCSSCWVPSLQLCSREPKLQRALNSHPFSWRHRLLP